MKLTPRLLVLASALLLNALLASQAQAQLSCDQCTPTSGCDDSCYYCTGPDNVDGFCSRTVDTTCGDYGGNTSGCMQSGCTPSYTEVSRELRGTYGTGYYFYCEHHRVEWLTERDVNQCNTNSAYWYRSSCDDTQDGYKWATFSVDCCDGRNLDGSVNHTYDCNHYHHC